MLGFTDRYFIEIPYGPFTDAPRKVPRERYEQAVELLILHWSSLPRRPIAIYQIGQVSAPGISDLDLVVVFSGEQPIDWSQYQPQAFPPWAQQLLTHPPYCCTERVWPDLAAWFPTFNLDHLWGEHLPEPKVPEAYVSGCSLGILVDYLITKVPRDFLWIAWERPLRLRILLALLHSLKHTVKLAVQAGFAIPERAQQSIAEVDFLRLSWFDTNSSNRLEALSHLCGEVCEIAGELISQVDEAITDLAGLKHSSPRGSCVGNHSDLFRFTAPWSYEESLRTAFEHYSQSGQFNWSSPLSFLQILAIYADQCPKFAWYLWAHTGYTKLRWDGGVWKDGLRYHARAMTAYGESATRLGVPAQKYVALRYSPQPSFWRSAHRYAVQVLQGKTSILEGMRRIVFEVIKRSPSQ